MNSGIYKLTFPGGLFYIGKSENMIRRWKEHHKKMQDGKAAKPLQNAYNNCGSPNASVLCYAHKDNIDVLEAAYICAALDQDPTRCLNTTIPEDPGFRTYQDDMVNKSLKEQMEWVIELQKQIEQYEMELEEQEIQHADEMASIKDGTRLRAVEQELHDVTLRELDLLAELKRKMSRNWFQRLFNLWPSPP